MNRYFTPMRFAMLLWLAVAALSIVLNFGAIMAQRTVDPDDALRLVQVRDLLNGQGWWDVSQHRINPTGGGGLMHWSRIVDAPLALGIMVLTPLLGQPLAESLVMALWPLILLIPLFWLIVRTMATLGEQRMAMVAAVLLAANQLILYQFRPLRIDHHGWQILLAGALLWLTLSPSRRRCGFWAGVAGAAYIAISLEALPALALFAAIMAAEWMATGDKAARERLIAYLVTLAATAALVQWMTRGSEGLFATWCDALSLPYMAAMGAAAAAVLIGAPLVDRIHPTRFTRAMLLGGAGLLSAAALATIESTCARGPFGALDPVVVEHWYVFVREGRPPWAILDMVTGFALAPTLIGLVATSYACRQSTGSARRPWLILLAALSGAALLSLFVLRTASVAHLFAIPGTAFAMTRMWRWARAIPQAATRILGSLSPLALFPPTVGAAAGLVISALGGANAQSNADEAPGIMCVNAPAVAGLDALPPELIFAPLDVGPHLLQRTRHSVMATGHHRNNAVMAQVISAFIASPDQAHAIIGRSHSRLLVTCPAAPEYQRFRRAAGDSLADQLASGRPPEWLEPIAMPAGSGIKVWRIRDDRAPAPTP